MSMIHVLSQVTAPERSHSADPDTRPHVLLVVDQLPRALGGGERIVLRLAALLPEYGYRASILTFAAHPETSALDAPPCPVYLLRLERTYDTTALRGAWALGRFLDQQNVRIVQTFFESSDIWAGFVTRLTSKARLIWSRRDMGILRDRKHHIAYRFMAGMPDRVFAVSEQVRHHGIEIDGIDPAKIHTVYNGLDLAAWSATPHPRDAARPYTIATVGNIRRVKGHDILIRAAAEVHAHSPTTRFIIGGEVLEPEYFAELERLVAELNLGAAVTFAGAVHDLRTFLATTDLFVLPSRSEGFSNAIIEAMAASLPVIATDVGGNAEAVQDGVTGFVVPSEDPGALARAILRLLADAALAEKMGAAGRHAASAKFTTEAMMRKITSVYAELLT